MGQHKSPLSCDTSAFYTRQANFGTGNSARDTQLSCWRLFQEERRGKALTRAMTRVQRTVWRESRCQWRKQHRLSSMVGNAVAMCGPVWHCCGQWLWCFCLLAGSLYVGSVSPVTLFASRLTCIEGKRCTGCERVRVCCALCE
ncbi:hypothetical protein TRVL_02639 [Trypanosoma vivax]|nr:hypothetical protein TRVL_02639 [Trypanosoma vivax]